MKTIVALLVLGFSLNAFSANTDAFNKRYKFVKSKEGKLLAIKDRYLLTQFIISPFIKKIINDIKEEQRRLRSSTFADRERQIDAFVESLNLSDDVHSFSGGSKGDIKDTIADAIKNLKNVNIDAVLLKVQKAKFITAIEDRMQKALLQLSLNTVSNLEDTKYFYRRNVTHEVVKFGLNLAKQRFSQVPLINFASFIVVRVEQALREQRVFSQNMLLYYFEKFPASKLGLTDEQVNKAISSIYESRISWSAFNESKYATSNWIKYGWTKFYSQLRMNNARLKSNMYRYEKTVNRINYAFAQVKEEGKVKVINLVNTWHGLTTQPAAAIYIDRPQKILIERRLMTLAEAGINFLPIPSWLKSMSETVIGSFYKGQSQTEGSLAGFFEAHEQFKLARIVYLQNQNPFLFLPQ